MKNPIGRHTVSILQACDLVHVSRRTIYNWLHDGKLEYVRTAGGSVRIFEDTLWRTPQGHQQPAADVAAAVEVPQP